MNAISWTQRETRLSTHSCGRFMLLLSCAVKDLRLEGSES